MLLFRLRLPHSFSTAGILDVDVSDFNLTPELSLETKTCDLYSEVCGTLEENASEHITKQLVPFLDI